jgi:Uncharacterized conserved protein
MTITDFLSRLKTGWRGTWLETPIDVLIYGDASVELRGAAVTMMATVESIEEAAALGCNLVISHEPVSFSHQGRTDFLQGDLVWAAKRELMDRLGIAVFHLHDNLHARPLDWTRRTEDRIARGMASALGWDEYRTDSTFRRFSMPGVELERITRQLEERLSPLALRYIGDPGAAYGRVATAWGFSMLENELALLSETESCLLVTGETHEWELVEYVHDARALGLSKALVVLGHIPSEEAALGLLVEELETMFPRIAIRSVKVGELFDSCARQ